MNSSRLHLLGKKIILNYNVGLWEDNSMSVKFLFAPTQPSFLKINP